MVGVRTEFRVTVELDVGLGYIFLKSVGIRVITRIGVSV